VAYRPPAWDARDRPGAVTVPAGVTMLVVEGVGSSRPALAHLLDASVWVQSDLAELDRRNAVRVGAGEMSPAGFDSWMPEELPFLAADRPWERTGLVVTDTRSLPHDPDIELVVADPPPAGAAGWTGGPAGPAVRR
jgi:hypothetical protein